VKGLGAPTDDTSAVSKKWVDDEIVKQASVTIQPVGFTMTGDIDMGNNKITKLTTGSDFEDAANVQYVHTYAWNNYLALNGFNKMKGELNAGGHGVRGLPTTAPRSDNAVSRFWVQQWAPSKFLSLDGSGSMSGNLDMSASEIKNLGNPTTGKSAVSKEWVEGGFTVGGDITMNSGVNLVKKYPDGTVGIAVTYLEVTAYIKRQAVKLTGEMPMTGNLKMGGNEIENLGSPTADTSAVSKKWVEDKISGGRRRRETYSGLTLSDDLDMDNNEILELGNPTTDKSAVSKKWVTDHVSGSSINSSGFTITGDIDMGGHHITGLAGGSVGDTAALSSKTIDTWGLQFVKRDGGTLASNLDANSFEITRVANPTTDGSAVSKKWVGDRYLEKTGGLVEGDLDMGDTSDIVNLRDPTNAKDAVNKQWVESNFASTIPSGKYVVKLHHKVAQWVWGYRGIAFANTMYHAYCHDGIPPMWRTDPINSLANINLETITVKSNSSLFSAITNVTLELILRVSIYVKQSNGKFTQQKKNIVLGTIDLTRLQHCYFLGTYQSDGRSTACYSFKGNSEYYIGGQAELVDNTMAWCVIVKPEQSMPIGKSMDMSFCWSLLYSGANGG
jgi:hypothetical protein